MLGWILVPLLISSVAGGTHRSSAWSHKRGYMVGEQFFKQEGETKPWGHGGQTKPAWGHEGNTKPHFHEDKDLEEMPYSVITDYGNYELRRYPSASLACTYHHVDQAADPLAGLEKYNPMSILMSKRWKTTPGSVMFRRLFKYISGVNQREEEIEMTKPVQTLHKVVKHDKLGDLEMQLMCFYLPVKYQANHVHKETRPAFNDVETLPSPVGNDPETKPAPVSNDPETKPADSPTEPAPEGRHTAVLPPLPMEGSRVLLYNRPEMEVYARRFGGWAFTTDTWEQHRQALLDDLIGKKARDNEYFSVSYDSPMQQENRRNDVLIQTEGGEEPADFVLLSQLVKELEQGEESEE